MPSQSTQDLTFNSAAYARDTRGFRATAALTYSPGLVAQLQSLDKQIYPDAQTITIPGTGAGQTKLVGVIADTWNGFNAGVGGAPNFVGPSSSAAVRGTSMVECVTKGYHPAVYCDQSGAGAVTIVDGIPLICSRATAGYVQGVAVASGTMGNLVGIAALPSTGIGSSLPAAALAQASQTVTIAGAPAAGDTISVTIQAPYNTVSPGTAQTITFTVGPLTGAQATSATTAAAAVVAYLNNQAAFSQYFTATNALGVVTITVNGASNPFAITWGVGNQTFAGIYLAVSGALANALTIAAAATGGSTAIAGGGTFAGGTGYKGTIAAFVAPGLY